MRANDDTGWDERQAQVKYDGCSSERRPFCWIKEGCEEEGACEGGCFLEKGNGITKGKKSEPKPAEPGCQKPPEDRHGLRGKESCHLRQRNAGSDQGLL